MIAAQLQASDAAVRSRRTASGCTGRRCNRLAAITPRRSVAPALIAQRRAVQQAKLGLPLFPTTTIGSFPQTAEVRPPAPRSAAATGIRRRIRTTVEGWIDDAVRWQEQIGLDVLVHGEFERNDMVEVFRRAARRLRLHPARLGAVLRQPLRGAADHLGRRVAPGADDGALVGLRAVADRAADEGHADRAGDDAAMVVRARRHSARQTSAARSRWPSATRWPTWRRPASR